MTHKNKSLFFGNGVVEITNQHPDFGVGVSRKSQILISYPFNQNIRERKQYH